jgi:hypothetical protein
MAGKRGARTTTFVNREAKQPAVLESVLAAVKQIVIVQPKAQATAVGQAPRRRPKSRPLDQDQLIALFDGVAMLGKHRGSSGLAKAARTAKARAVRDLKALVVAMQEHHTRLHRLLDLSDQPCGVADGTGCRSTVGLVIEHANVIRQLKVRAGLEEALLATFLERVPRFGLMLQNVTTEERRRVDDLPSLLAALRDLAGLAPVDLGFLRAAIDVSFRLPIDEDLEAATLHAVHQALHVWDHPPRERIKTSGVLAEARDAPDSK